MQGERILTTWYRKQLSQDGTLLRRVGFQPPELSTGHSFVIAVPLTPEDGVLLRKGSYSAEEVEAVAEGYEELGAGENKAWIQVRLIDLRRAFETLKPERQQAVLLVGMLGYSTRQAAPYLQVSHTTVANRYKAGLGAMKLYLNGSTPLVSNRTSTGAKPPDRPLRRESPTVKLRTPSVSMRAPFDAA